MDYFTGAPLAESSIKLYNTKIHKWLSMTPHKNIFRLIVFHRESYDILLKNLTEKDNTSTNRHMFLSAILALFNHTPHIISQLPPGIDCQTSWQTLMVKNSESIRERRLENRPTIAQEKKEGSSFTFQQVCNIRDTLPTTSIDKLLLGFYTYIPCVRADFFATQIIREKEVPLYPNYIVLSEETASLTLTDFKSKNKYKKIEHASLPKELVILLTISLRERPRKFLFVDDVGDPFTRGGFSTWTARRLSKALHVNKFTLVLLRHIYVSSLDMNMSTKDLEKISSLMGHSLMTQRSYKWSGDGDSEESDIKNEVIEGDESCNSGSGCCADNSISICNSCNTITITSGENVTRISSDMKEAYKAKLLEILKRLE